MLNATQCCPVALFAHTHGTEHGTASRLDSRSGLMMQANRRPHNILERRRRCAERSSKVGAVVVSAVERGTRQVGPSKTRPPNDSAREVGVLQLRGRAVGEAEVGGDQGGVAQIGAREKRAREASAAHVDVRHAGAFEARAAKGGAAQVGE
eukprot:CAMPEP_0119385508 /NCGR_PEP_ID=MMETSP1334-20130426/91531_1 /TAXON_ID=127549 /ORGANISM="Calcidiscus leptoporus, Strain RCC1130" /LENGTH=150 /DNA_ID=CAMNT_0007406803 /DNA_START=84 /DNA_END=533 /DNA_ORIENTATION=+